MNARFARPAQIGWLALCLSFLAFPASSVRAAGGQPVTIKEICLMLRGGYTGDEVVRETAGRPLLDPVDADAEKNLRAAGADARFIAALKFTHRTLTPDEAAAARQRQDALNQRTAASLQAELLRQQQSARPADAQGAGGPAPFAPSDSHYIANLLNGKLVTFENGSFRPTLGNVLEKKKVIALYCSTYVSAAGRQFAPELAKFYRGILDSHPEFEVVAVSGDSSVYDMENMVRREEMPWPALAFDQIKELKMVAQLIDHTGSSRMVVVDNSGRMLADYSIALKNTNIPLFLPDLQKVLANPGTTSTLAPPQQRTNYTDQAAADAANAPTSTTASNVSPAKAGVTSAGAGTDPGHMASLLRGKLVTYSDGALQSYDDSKLARKKYFGLYYSAHWCGPCRKFTPDLVAFYQQMAAQHPELEIVFLSDDHSAGDMLNYMKEVGMPWAAVRFEWLKGEKELAHYCGSGIPDLVIVDGTGRVLSDSYRGVDYLGPQKPMADLGWMLTKNGGG